MDNVLLVAHREVASNGTRSSFTAIGDATHLAHDLHDFPDLIILVEADIRDVAQRHIVEAGFLLLFGNEDLFDLSDDTVKFGAEGIPMDANFWIQLKELAPNDTRIKLTVKADIPMMFKMMIGKKLQDGLDQAADMLAQFPYGQWN